MENLVPIAETEITVNFFGLDQLRTNHDNLSNLENMTKSILDFPILDVIPSVKIAVWIDLENRTTRICTRSQRLVLKMSSFCNQYNFARQLSMFTNLRMTNTGIGQVFGKTEGSLPFYRQEGGALQLNEFTMPITKLANLRDLEFNQDGSLTIQGTLIIFKQDVDCQKMLQDLTLEVSETAMLVRTLQHFNSWIAQSPTDFMLVAKDGCAIGVHKLILQARSEFFRAYFSENWQNADTNQLTIDVSSQALRFAIEYLKFGRLSEFRMHPNFGSADTPVIKELMFIAAYFLLDDLKSSFCDLIKVRCDESNALYLKTVCEDFSLNEPLEYVNSFITCQKGLVEPFGPVEESNVLDNDL